MERGVTVPVIRYKRSSLDAVGTERFIGGGFGADIADNLLHIVGAVGYDIKDKEIDYRAGVGIRF